MTTLGRTPLVQQGTATSIIGQLNSYNSLLMMIKISDIAASAEKNHTAFSRFLDKARLLKGNPMLR